MEPLACALTYAYGLQSGFKIMGEGRHVRLFRNGRNQAVRIPVEFEIDGVEAIMRKEGDRLIIETLHTNQFAALLSSWEPIEDEFPSIDEFEIPLDNPALDK